MKKLVNYDMVYESYYETDSGLSHIRRFIHPFMNRYPILEIYVKYLSTTAHGTLNRFKVLDKFIKNQDYWKFINLYYYIIKNYFYIGTDKDNYIEFREWSKSVIKLPNNLKESFKKKYSWKKESGHIYSDNNEWINQLKVKKSIYFEIDENKLIKLHKFSMSEMSKSTKTKKFPNIKQIIKMLLQR